jgi:hypothetical protein
MGWEEQGRQEHGWFGNGTSAQDKQAATTGDGGVPGRLTERVQAVILGAVAALPRESRYRAAARLDVKTLDRLTNAMTAWARGAGTDMASFAGRFFGRSADDPIVGKLWAAATMADRARSHADLGVAANFGAPTGIEAFRASPRQSPCIRDTISVGVCIMHDPTSPKGYSVKTAYPMHR